MAGGDLVALATGGVFAGAGPNLVALSTGGVWSLLPGGREVSSGRVLGTVRAAPVVLLASAARVGGSVAGDVHGEAHGLLEGQTVPGAAQGKVQAPPTAINRRARALPTIEEK